MDARKNKVFVAAIVIVGAIIVLMFVLNKFNVIQKFENFVDNEEEGYEEDDEQNEETFQEQKKLETKPKASETEFKKLVDEINKPDTKTGEDPKEAKPINDISAKFRKLIDEMDKQLRNKNVSDDIKKKVMTELMGTIETFNKLGDDTSNIITSIIQKYIPKQDNYADAPVVSKSMTTIKKYLQDALKEIEHMESSNNTAVPKTVVRERFVQSRDVPVSKTTKTDNEDVIEGFENTPHYALY